MATNRQLAQLVKQVRNKTVELCQPLLIEDYVIQGIDDVSPPKWHLAHTTWFFETFILLNQLKGYQAFDPLFQYLFNSYYQSLGNPYPRVRRGILSRPTVETVYQYRKYVDDYLISYIDYIPMQQLQTIEPIFMLGLHHEQQHQELLLMDIKYNFSLDPSFPIYHEKNKKSTAKASRPLELIHVEGGTIEIGHRGNNFCFDNELPRYQVIIKPYLFATRLVTNGEYAEFIESEGYQKPNVWLADGWDCIKKNGWEAPLYWKKIDGKWHEFTLNGLQELNLAAPVAHISYYEADAYARWRNLRLPLEVEWEHYATQHPTILRDGNFMEEGLFHPRVSTVTDQQLLGDLWEWTASPYTPYPGYKPMEGALGEYNGKFMSNQFVLRGGCCATPKSHIRPTYRNFFQPDKRWQFSGIRLAGDA
ncbi:MAG: ergothioneine biosynthesis protein EgtB [Gammaproteobacteria bacterium]|nr:ergothioneine biosynthesis protein EgtB [Gammaproteobacteria bacterium]MCW5583339.1 ergothioneine biosynthesis protein EgtB [Gammaproteobacteria bacterium]